MGTIWSFIMAIPGAISLANKFESYVLRPLRFAWRKFKTQKRDEKYERAEDAHTQTSEEISVAGNKPNSPENDQELRNAHNRRYEQETKK